MTQPSRIFSLAVFVAASLLLPSKAAAQSAPAAAQNSVTPTVKPTPPGQLIVVNNSPGANHTDPHIDGDLVSYTNQQSATNITIHYHDLNTGTDATIPIAGGSVDFLSDVRGTTIVFTRDSSEADIFSFDIASATLTILSPQPNTQRFSAQIGDQTIVWEDCTNCTASTIVAYDRATFVTTVLSASTPVINQNPGISPDGSVVVWENCPAFPNCVIWKSTRSNVGIWNSQQLVSQFAAASHPDTDGTMIAYAALGPSTTQLAWQTVAGGTEQVLNLPGSGIDPTVSGGLICFAYDATGSGLHQIALYNIATNVLYNLSADANPGDTNDKLLNDVSVTPNGKVRVVWQAQENGQFNLYAYTFNLPQNSVTPTVKPTPAGQLIVVNNSAGADHFDPHVSGDLVAYSNAVGFNFTIRYHDLVTGTDNAVPNAGSFDFLSDVRGSTIAFTRVNQSASAIFTFETSAASATEVDPTPGSSRQAAQIGDQTIAWQEFSTNGQTSDIVAFDRQSAAAIRVTSDGMLNQAPAISPDGTVIVWIKCANVASPCSTSKATLSNGAWTAQPLVSQGGNQSHPDTDGTIIAYSSNFGTGFQIVWQPVSVGTEQVLNLQGGQGENPSISGGPQNSLIAFAYLPAGAAAHDLAIYDVAANVLYDVTKDAMPGNTADKQLSDISVTPDGKVRVVWQQQDAQLSIYAYTFNRPMGDFSISPITPLTISAGNSASTNVTVNPANGFSSAVDLTVTGQPNGVSAPPPSPAQVTPSGGNPASSILNVSVSPALAPTNFTLTVTGTSGTLTHSATADVTVTATTSSIGNLIGGLVGAGCLDNIANALTSKLSAAQAAASTQTAINILTALKNQINAQAAKHIATACTIAGVAFNPVTVLLLDVQGVIDSLRVSAIPDPITGYVVDMNGVGVPGATVSILDASTSMPVATTTTDITGFYFFATMSVLTPNASYTVAVTGLPPGFLNTPPASPAFMWSGSGMMIGNFVLN